MKWNAVCLAVATLAAWGVGATATSQEAPKGDAVEFKWIMKKDELYLYDFQLEWASSGDDLDSEDDEEEDDDAPKKKEKKPTRKQSSENKPSKEPRLKWKEEPPAGFSMAVNFTERDEKGVRRNVRKAGDDREPDLTHVSEELVYCPELLYAVFVLPPKSLKPGEKHQGNYPDAVPGAEKIFHAMTYEKEERQDGDPVCVLKGLVSTRVDGKPVELEYESRYSPGGYIRSASIVRCTVIPEEGPDVLHLRGKAALRRKVAADAASFQGWVDETIDKGAAYLKSIQNADGSFQGEGGCGESALCMLALVKCEPKLLDPAVEKGMEYLLKAKVLPNEETYTCALLCLLVESYLEAHAKGAALANEHPNKLPPMEEKRRKALEVRMKGAAEALLTNFVANKYAGFTYGNGKGGNGLGAPDYSNVQFGVLGLLAAAKGGVKIDPSIWVKILEAHIRAQVRPGEEVKLNYLSSGAVLKLQDDKNGTKVSDRTRARGWGYMAPNITTNAKPPQQQRWESATTSMTWGGLGSVAGARAQLIALKKLPEGLDKPSLEAIRSAIAFLQGGNIVVDAAEVSEDFYGMYAMEKGSSLSGLTTIGGVDWYRDGAVALCSRQNIDGSWNGETENIATSFALLFLKRASRGLVTTDFVAPKKEEAAPKDKASE